MTTDRLASDLLLERHDELQRSGEALAGAVEGQGALLLVEGPAGIGKTRLTRAIAEIAAARGFEVHWARGDELEHGFAYGVLRQVLSSVLEGLGRSDRAAVLDGPAASVVHVLGGGDDHGDQDALSLAYGFSRLLGDMADRRPRLLCVDDAHWADLPSLRALRFACRRTTDLPVLTVFTYRRPLDDDRRDLLERLATSVTTTRLWPSPLGVPAVSTLAASVLDHRPDDAFCRDLVRLTGGNPFLVHELLRAAREQEPAAEPLGATDLDDLVPARIVAAVQRRLSAIGGHAGQLADAVAVLGETTLRDAARLAELEEADAVTAADGLAAAGMLVAAPTLGFTHPILRRVVAASIPAARLSLMHARAARVLAGVGAQVEHVASHLIEALPRGDPWVVTALLSAARRERRRGSPETAAPLLARAVDEPPPEERRLEVILALAEVQAQIRHPQAVITARRALDLAVDPRGQAAARLQLVRTFGLSGDFQSALDLLDDPLALGDGIDPDLTLRVEAEVAGVARLHGDTRDEALTRIDALAPHATPARRSSVVLLANLALSALERNEAPSRVARLAEQALSQGWLIGVGSVQLVYAVTALIWVDHLTAAERACDAALDAAGQTGSVSLTMLAHSLRSQLDLRRGHVADATADARICAELTLADAPAPGTPYARAHLADALLERAELDEADRVLSDPHPSERAYGNPSYLFARGQLRLACGDPAAALEDLLASGRTLTERGGADTPTMFPWRSHAARALVQLDDRRRARNLADQELAHAIAGQVAGAIGHAQATVGLIEGGDRGQERLRTAVEMLEESPRVLMRIRAMIELGAMVRRCGEPTRAREPLKAALDLAHRHGAIALEERAREELVVAGGRPRRAALTGLAALTPSEHRVAQLVGRGHSNREIADRLFVSPRTVSTHLTHIYQKLGHAGRDELTAFLADQL